jgi:hypothetical protein
VKPFVVHRDPLPPPEKFSIGDRVRAIYINGKDRGRGSVVGEVGNDSGLYLVKMDGDTSESWIPARSLVRLSIVEEIADL